MESKEQLLGFEIISLLIMILCMFFTLIKIQYIKLKKLQLFAHIFMWFLFVLFVLNTVGNIIAETNFEKLFGIITAVLAFFTLRLALEKNK